MATLSSKHVHRIDARIRLCRNLCLWRFLNLNQAAVLADKRHALAFAEQDFFTQPKKLPLIFSVIHVSEPTSNERIWAYFFAQLHIYIF